jgi:Domain of unknown function (DUF5122) beta-propeller
VFSVALQRAGKTIAGGWVNSQMAFARFNTDGTVDTSFGSNGSVMTYHEGFWDSWQKVPFNLIKRSSHTVRVGSQARKPGLESAIPLGLPNATQPFREMHKY